MITAFKSIIIIKARLNMPTRLAIRFGFVIILAHDIRRIVSIDTVFVRLFLNSIISVLLRSVKWVSG